MLRKSIKRCEDEKEASPCRACHWQRDCIEYAGYDEPRKLQYRVLIIAHRHGPPRELLRLLNPIIEEGFVVSPRYARANDMPALRSELKNATPDLVIVQVDTGKPVELVPLLELSLYTPCLPVLAISLRDEPDFTVRLIEKGVQGVLYARGLTTVRLRSAIREAVERERRVRVRRAQTEVERVHQENLVRLIESLPDAVVALTRSGQVLIVNSAAQKLFMCSEQEMRRGTFGLPVVEGEQAEVEILRGDGTLVPVEMRLVTTKWNGDDGYLAVLRDISERKNLEATKAVLVQKREKLRRLEGIRALASGIAHEFNNLLMGIMGHATLASKLVNGAPASDSLQRILESGEKAASLTHQLLAFSGQGRFLVERVLLGEAIEEVVTNAVAGAESRISIVIEGLDKSAAIEGDPTLIRSLLHHLVTNAVEAMPGRGKLSIRMSVKPLHELQLRGLLFPPRPGSGSYVAIEIGDTGGGIEGADSEQIFEPFYSTKGIGRGLGLAAVVGIVRSHAGSISVQSIPGKGAIFTVILPTIKDETGSSVLRAANSSIVEVPSTFPRANSKASG